MRDAIEAHDRAKNGDAVPEALTSLFTRPAEASHGSTPFRSMRHGGANAAAADAAAHHHPGRNDMTRSNHRFAAFAAAMALAVTGATLAAATPVFAADVVVSGTTAPTARVDYADLDLRSPAGVARLEHRVADAADRFCVGIGVETLAARLDGSRCRDATIAAAQPQIHRAIERVSTAQASPGRAITLTLGH
jgi:UrcA family protein